MKIGRKWYLVLLLAGCLPGGPARAELHSFTALNLPIPDGNASGLHEVRTITSSIAHLESVRLQLRIDGQFNGDLYGYIRHVHGGITNFCVLLNRPGRTAASSSGYPDSGLDIWFDDTAGQGDIHTYRAITTPTAGTPLTGSWETDRRATNPDTVLDTSPRSLSLSSFIGANANGEWTLYLADLAAGGTHTLVSWGLELTGTDILSGTVRYYLGSETVPGALVSLSGDDSQGVTTPSNGAYSFIVPAGGDYTLTPSKNDDATVATGVTALDNAMIQRHIVALTLLDSPYKLIAADVNGTSSVTALDNALIQRLIVGLNTSFPAGMWRFVPANHVFGNPAVPWPFPSARTYSDLSGDAVNQDFLAIKLGDANASWKQTTGGPSSFRRPKTQPESWPSFTPTRQTSFSIESQIVRPGELVTVPIVVSGFDTVTSVQFTLAWDPAALALQSPVTSVLAGFSNENLNHLAPGRLAFAWSDPQATGLSLQAGATLLELRFEPIGRPGTGSTIGFMDHPTPRELSAGFEVVPAIWNTGSITILDEGAEVRCVTITAAAAGTFRIIFGGVAGTVYSVEYTESLSAPAWTPVGSFTAGPEGHFELLTVPHPDSVAGFYRASLLPR